jgi:DNA repair protein RecO (recombination protein O)
VETIKTEGIILKTYPLAERDRIVSVYTKALGRLSGVVSQARGPSSRYTGRLQTFGLVELVFLLQAHRDLVKVQSVELISSFGEGLPSYQNFLHLSLIAEVLSETSPEREPNDDLFRLLLLVMPCCKHPDGGSLAALYFEIWYLKFSGVLPSTRTCRRCGTPVCAQEEVFVLKDLTGLVCAGCRTTPDRRLSQGAFSLLGNIRQKSLIQLYAERQDASSIAELSQVGGEMLEIHFERRFQSLRLLKGEGV